MDNYIRLILTNFISPQKFLEYYHIYFLIMELLRYSIYNLNWMDSTDVGMSGLMIFFL